MNNYSMRPLFKWPLIIMIAIWACRVDLHAAATPDTTQQRSWLSAPLTQTDARHLISRTGFGVSLPELIAMQDLTRAEAVDLLIQGFRLSADLSMPLWTSDTAPVFWTRQDLSADDKRRFDRKRDTELAELRQWWINALLTTNSPQTERMVLFWHDHFATSYHSINRQSIAMARQNQTFRELGMGSFKDLVSAMLRDPALLNYLDNLSNRKGSPNENLARELLELFTLGEGNYQEQTVREAARALTGFNVSQNKNLSFEYQTWSHDTDLKTLFGKTGHYDSDDLVDLIFEQEALAPFIASKFWHAFIADHPPSAQQLKHLASQFKDSNFNISALYRATLESEAFWSEANRAGLIKSPAQLIIGFARTTDYPKKLSQQIPALMARSGMDLFAPPNVAGWSEGASWITSDKLLNRYNAIDILASSDTEPFPATEDYSNSMTSSMASKQDDSMTMASNSTVPPNPVALQKLEIQMAGENYEGPVNYRVELLNAEKYPLWNSGTQKLPGGHDTRKYGRVRNTPDLPWQTIHFNVNKTTASEAQFLQVHFLNDNSDYDGDRNMYINGAGFDDQWIDSSIGKQVSNCIPNSPADAGNLYCNGTLSLPLQTLAASPTAPTKSNNLLASSVHLQWVRWLELENKLDLILTLQNLQTTTEFFPVFSFHLKADNGSEPQLELSSYGCWPDCVTQWPDCSWQDNIDTSRKTLVFPLSGAGEKADFQCHFEALTTTEKTLVRKLMNNAPLLLSEALDTHREFSEKQKAALEQWQKLFKKHQTQFTTPSLDLTSGNIDISEKWQRSKASRQTAAPLAPGLHSLSELDAQLRTEGLTLAQVLLPGIDSHLLSGLEHLSQKSLSAQLQILINSPAFQLH